MFVCRVCGWLPKNRRRVAEVIRKMQELGLISEWIYAARKGRHGRHYIFDYATSEDARPSLDDASEELQAFAEDVAKGGQACLV